MKKTSVLFFVSLFVSQLSSAQLRLGFGVKGGGGISAFRYTKFTYLQQSYRDWTPGYYGGFLGNVSLGKFFFQPELLYSKRGNHTEGYGYEEKLRFHYISVPLLIGYKPFKQLSVMAGPEFGRLLNARSKNTFNSMDVTDFVQHRNSIDLDFGAAWALNSKLAIEARYVRGLTPLYDNYRGGPSPMDPIRKVGEDGYNRVVQLGIAYRFR